MKKRLLWIIYFLACTASIQAQTLFGMTTNGGNGKGGTIIKFTPATNNLTVVKSFENYAAGPYHTNLIQASNGKLYGMTSTGGTDTGSHGSGYFGVIFSYDPSTSAYIKLKAFNNTDGANPKGSLVQANNGKLYGMTQYGGSGAVFGGNLGYGVIFSFDPATSTYTKLMDFDGYNGANPEGSLMQATDGKLYGMTSHDIFSYDPSSSSFTKLKDFDNTSGYDPYGSLMQASNGKLYGMTSKGGTSGYGTIFSFDPSSSTYTKLKDFDNTNGGDPWGSLMQANDGKLYGMTISGGSNPFGYGVIFSFDPSSSTYTKLHDFDYPNGTYPGGDLIQATDGKLYGMTHDGASSGGNSGTIFSFDPSSSTYTKLKEFNGTDGGGPYGGLMQANDGKLYGMTSSGGGGGAGVIFSYNLSTSTYKKLTDLDATDGRNPFSSLIQASNGKLYGMTVAGGSSPGGGVIFSYDPSTSVYTKLMDFDFNNGRFPFGSLIQASNGKLYGTTFYGGAYGAGVIFSFDLSTSIYTILKDFDYNNGGEEDPGGSLVQASNGKLYGTTQYSGGNGVIFSFDPSTSVYTKLIDFNCNNGCQPWGGGMMEASNGKLYGMTARGGTGGFGVIFSFDPTSSTYTKLKDFDNAIGDDPHGSLVQASDGKLYGMTSTGGGKGYGVIFSFDPSSSTYTKLKDFDGTNGAYPLGSLMQASDGKLYGMTTKGGSLGFGVIFSFDPSSSVYTKLKDFDWTNGANPWLGSAFIEVSNIASVSINITSGVNPTCIGQSITFTASPVNGGSSPSYQWKVNGNNVGANSPTYTTNTLTNGQVVSCVMTSSATSATATSNSITMNVNSAVTPSASITITSGANPSCAAQQITFTANPTNGGSNPNYQWEINGNNVGTNSPTFTSNSLTNGQVVSCVMTSDLSCASPATVTSNLITVTINSNVIPASPISITSGANPSCAGQSITFTATPTNGGSSPVYQWKVNGNNVGTNSPTYTSTTLTNGQVVNCVMTSTLACASPVTATSNNISMIINPIVVPAITISQTSCNGNIVGFTSNTTNGGSNSSYLWSFTGTGTAADFTGSNFTLSNAANGTQVQCSMTSNAACASPTTVISTPLTVNCVASGVVSPANLDLHFHPNPANQNTVITFYLGASARISIAVFNIVGQQIGIIENAVLSSGNQTIPWKTERLAAGVYLIRFTTVNFSTAKRIVVIH